MKLRLATIHLYTHASIITCVGKDVASKMLLYNIQGSALLEGSMAASIALGHSNSTSRFLYRSG